MLQTSIMQNFQITIQEQKAPPPTNRVQESSTIQIQAKVAGQFMRKLFQILFYCQLILITILTVFLSIRGVVSSWRSHHFHPKKWYPPMLASVASSGLIALTWQWIVSCNPSKAIKACFWLSPLLTFAVGILFLIIGSASGSAIGVIAIVCAVIQSLYTCWVNPRFEYAIKILSISTAFPPAKTTFFVVLSIIVGVVYSSLLVSGIGGATATGTGLDILFKVLILLSLAWSMQVIKNVVLVTISRVKYINFAYGADFCTGIAFRDTNKHLMGSVIIGSALVPIFGVIRGSSRTISLVVGDADEFLFSCADCYSSVAMSLGTLGNRWGFVHVGVYNKGFVQASVDTWDMFRMVGMEMLIDSDLTGAFCFLSGIAGAAICALVGGIWTLAVHKSYAIEVSIYAFLFGYFMCRVALAWPQACVSAYYVAYADNPQGPRFDSTIPARIQELQRHQT
ncbi:hypothetical protein Dsin_021612 [Dipteronia sinensis]|uniref:Choline transporter-like protein n=1 Tax=Dipteronia sinensis TaxID=43782 RepID=A0AAE0A0V8_9ROSI|nr:hypothetical protein Dsin_021612 [Dipteronia sinensis]